MFVLIETIMNRDITKGVGCVGFDFPTFQEAVVEIKKQLSKFGSEDIEIMTDTNEEFCYQLTQEQITVTGISRNIHMEVHKG